MFCCVSAVVCCNSGFCVSTGHLECSCTIGFSVSTIGFVCCSCARVGPWWLGWSLHAVWDVYCSRTCAFWCVVACACPFACLRASIPGCAFAHNDNWYGVFGIAPKHYCEILTSILCGRCLFAFHVLEPRCVVRGDPCTGRRARNENVW